MIGLSLAIEGFASGWITDSWQTIARNAADNALFGVLIAFKENSARTRGKAYVPGYLYFLTVFADERVFLPVRPHRAFTFACALCWGGGRTEGTSVPISKKSLYLPETFYNLSKRKIAASEIRKLSSHIFAPIQRRKQNSTFVPQVATIFHADSADFV